MIGVVDRNTQGRRRGDLIFVDDRIDGVESRFALADGRYDVVDQETAVVGDDEQIDFVFATGIFFIPFTVDESFGFVNDVGAILTMDFDPLAFGDIPDDIVPVDR